MRRLKKSIRISISLILLLLCAFSRSRAATLNELWVKGNESFQQQKYDQALSYYQEIEKGGKHSAALYYNMGNVYYRLGKMGPAILNYQRAAFQDPGSKEVRDNLLLAQSKVVLPVTAGSPIFFISWWNRLLSGGSPNFWAFIMFLSFLGALWFLFQKIKLKEKVLSNDRLLAFSFIVFLLTGLLFYSSDHIRTNNNQAVIMTANTPFFKAPNAPSPSGNLPEGASVHIKDGQPGWCSVVLPNGAVAWVRSENLERVVAKK